MSNSFTQAKVFAERYWASIKQDDATSSRPYNVKKPMGIRALSASGA